MREVTSRRQILKVDYTDSIHRRMNEEMLALVYRVISGLDPVKGASPSYVMISTRSLKTSRHLFGVLSSETLGTISVALQAWYYSTIINLLLSYRIGSEITNVYRMWSISL